MKLINIFLRAQNIKSEVQSKSKNKTQQQDRSTCTHRKSEFNVQFEWHFICYFQFSIMFFICWRTNAQAHFNWNCVKRIWVSILTEEDPITRYRLLFDANYWLVTNNKMKFSIRLLSLKLPDAYCSDAYQISEEIKLYKM